MRVHPLLVAAALTLTAACGQAQGSSPVADAPLSSPTPTAGAVPPPTPAPPPPTPAPPPSPAPTPVVDAGDGELTVVPGGTAAAGSGEPVPYVVEVEGGLGVDAAGFAAEVDRVLADPRSWRAAGGPALHRVDAADTAVRVALVSPSTVDRLCAPLDTGGSFSCASGGRAVLNVARWLTGAPAYDGRLGEYRQYLVNHEVGHVLGHGHEQCPGAGRPAPVMLQQTKGLSGCTHNAWPYP